MSETPNMIKVFPGSDDSRGTTTRISYQEVQEVGESYGPEMRPDEYTGPVGEFLKYYNLTRQTVNICEIIDVDGLKSLNQAIDTVFLFDNFSAAVGNLETLINEKIAAVVTELGLDPIAFWLTKVDILNSYMSPSGLHNQSGSHTVFVTMNYDVIIYGQFTPNPFVEPAPEPEPCVCFTPSFTTTKQFLSTNNNGVFTSNIFNINGTPTVQNGSLYVRAQGSAAPGANAIATAASILTGNVFYTLKYDISANLQTIVTPGEYMQITVKVNAVIAGIFDLNTIAKSGYMQFLAPTGWTNPTIVEVTYTKAFPLADRGAYPSATATWHVNFQLCNASCQNVMP